MRVGPVSFITFLILIVFISITAWGASKIVAPGCRASASIEAVATVVPPVGIEAAGDVSRIDEGGAPLSFWIHAPRPGGVYVTVTDGDGRPVCLRTGSLSVLEWHRYRSLLCIADDIASAPDESLTLTIIYTAD